MNKRITKTYRRNKLNKTIIFTVLLPLLFSLVSFDISAQDDEVTIEDYNGRPIGVLVGPLTQDIANEFFPDSKHLLFNSYPDCITALLTNKIDGYIADEPGLKMVCAEQREITYLPQRMMVNNYSFAFRKNDPQSAALCDEVSEFIERCWEDGTMKQIDEIWFGLDEELKVVDMSDLNKDGRIIRVATTSSDIPFSYIKDGKNVGYDIDVVVRFCREKGYGLELVDVDFTGRIPEVESGKCDFTTGMNVTPEREEQVLFSTPDGYGGIVLAVRKADLEGKKDNSSYRSMDELANKRIGVTTGSIHDKLIADRLPSAQIMYFTGLADLSAALKAGAIDAFACPRSAATFMSYEDEKLTWLDEHLTDGRLAFAFAKNEKGKKTS